MVFMILVFCQFCFSFQKIFWVKKWKDEDGLYDFCVTCLNEWLKWKEYDIIGTKWKDFCVSKKNERIFLKTKI
jgi:hypothetical protein